MHPVSDFYIWYRARSSSASGIGFGFSLHFHRGNIQYQIIGRIREVKVNAYKRDIGKDTDRDNSLDQPRDYIAQCIGWQQATTGTFFSEENGYLGVERGEERGWDELRTANPWKRQLKLPSALRGRF